MIIFVFVDTLKVKSLLLVEDDPDDQDLFELALQEVDKTVELIKAADGIDALEKLSVGKVNPDLIILDINMPRMNGRDFLQAVKANEDLRHIPVVLYSTTSETNFVREIISMGARSFFKKPDTFNTLCAEVREALHN